MYETLPILQCVLVWKKWFCGYIYPLWLLAAGGYCFAWCHTVGLSVLLSQKCYIQCQLWLHLLCHVLQIFLFYIFFVIARLDCTFVLHVSKLCEFLFWPCMYVTTLQTVASPKLLLPLFKISVSCRITYNNMRMWHMKKSHEMISAEWCDILKIVWKTVVGCLHGELRVSI